jgi:hypothetical protein
VTRAGGRGWQTVTQELSDPEGVSAAKALSGRPVLIGHAASLTPY